MNLLRDFIVKYSPGERVDNLSDWFRFKGKIRKRHPVRFNEREIWWCAIGMNVGYEIDGKGKNFSRPVLVLKKISKENFIGLPMTSTKKDLPGYYEYRGDRLVFEQVRVFNSRRLLDRIETVPDYRFAKIHKHFLNYMSPS